MSALVRAHRHAATTLNSNHTQHHTAPMQGLYDIGNVSAVLRSAEAFGIEDIHLINRHDDKFKVARSISVGAEKWLRLHHFSRTEECFEHLQSKGYHVAVAHCPSVEAVAGESSSGGSVPAAATDGGNEAVAAPLTTLTELDLTQKTAGANPMVPAGAATLSRVHTATARHRAHVLFVYILHATPAPLTVTPHRDHHSVAPLSAVVFGNEFAGMSEAAINLSDSCFHIDTGGFAQSLNVSAAAAIVFHEGAMQAKACPPSAAVIERTVAEYYARSMGAKGMTLKQMQDSIFNR